MAARRAKRDAKRRAQRWISKRGGPAPLAWEAFGIPLNQWRAMGLSLDGTRRSLGRLGLAGKAASERLAEFGKAVKKATGRE